MSKVESLEREVAKLTPQELAAFRERFANYDADAWDRQIESDVKAGKLDRLAAEALAAHDRAKPRTLSDIRNTRRVAAVIREGLLLRLAVPDGPAEPGWSRRTKGWN